MGAHFRRACTIGKLLVGWRSIGHRPALENVRMLGREVDSVLGRPVGRNGRTSAMLGGVFAYMRVSERGSRTRGL